MRKERERGTLVCLSGNSLKETGVFPFIHGAAVCLFKLVNSGQTERTPQTCCLNLTLHRKVVLWL